LKLPTVEGRGFGGGGGRGGFDAYRGYAGDYGRGYGDGGWGNYGRDYGYRDPGMRDTYGDPGRLDSSRLAPNAVVPRGDELSPGQREAAANHVWNSLPTDSGLGSVAGVAGYGHTGNYTYGMSRAALGEEGNRIRNGNWDRRAFTRDWWLHRDGWWNSGWGDDWAWGGMSWPLLAGYWGMPEDNAPSLYDFGENITYQNNNVYYGSQPVESADAYYQQAQNLALAGTENDSTSAAKPNSKDWKPMGVFALVQKGQTSSTTMFEIAVDKKGKIRGNCYDQLTNQIQPISGSVNKKDTRAAWTVVSNANVVYDTGIANLLAEQAPILVHFGKDRTEQYTLVRLKQAKT
jgi:hypothetical protein